MSAEDFEVFKEMRRRRQEKRQRNLENADGTNWNKFTPFHWYREVNGSRLEYWPSSNKWLYRGKYYRGDLPNEIKSIIDAEDGKC